MCDSFRRRLSWGAKQKVASSQAKQHVRTPRGKRCGQSVDVAHGFKSAGHHPVRNGEANCGSDAGEAAAFAHRESKGNGEEGHDKGDERIGEFAV